MEPETLKFIRRGKTTDYLSDQAFSVAGASVTVEDMLIGADLQAYEFELEGKRVVLLGYEAKN